MTNESDTYGLPDHDIYFLSQWFVFLFFYYNQPNIFGFEDFSDKSHKLKTSAWGFGKISETYATAFWCPNIWSVIQEKIFI